MEKKDQRTKWKVTSPKAEQRVMETNYTSLIKKQTNIDRAPTMCKMLGQVL